MRKSLLGFFWVGLLLACGLLMNGAGARAEEPWVRICAKPTLVDPTDLHCKARPGEYEIFNFRVGCYNVTEGRYEDCEAVFQEYFSLEGVPTSERLVWTGGHDHSRATGDPERTLGAVRCDVDENAGGDPTRFHGRTQNQVFDAYKVMPEASGVIRMTGRYTWDNSRRCRPMPDDTWHLDPADPSGRTVYAEIAFVVGIEGLEELPDSEDYDKVSYHAGHSDPVFCGTPEMNRRLAELARQFKQSYPQESQVSFNDLSLRYGGLYDINQDWTCDHTLHREGKSADVNRTVPKTKLEKVAANLGFTECHPGKSLIHFELGPCEKKRST